jgi:hypothetical protein
MIERYTIKFGPAVSQKELEKLLHEAHEATSPAILATLHKMKARIEVVGDFEDLKKLNELVKQLALA